MSSLLHHNERTANADLKRSTSDNNSGVIPAKILCNAQPEKNVGNSSPTKGPGTANNPQSKLGKM